MINQELYDNLMTLCETNEAFFFKDFPVYTGGHYRIFNYRLATYTDFMLPGALECRGIMFELDKDGNALRVASRPMEKFFNDGENPSTIGLDYSDPMQVMYKEDGSLISTYLHNGNLRLKTKGSLSSEQANDAMDWLSRKENDYFAATLFMITSSGFTVNMEWVAPHNRIVLNYEKAKLVILNVRCNVSGAYVRPGFFSEFIETVALNHWVESYNCGLIEDVHKQKDMEGVVVQLSTGQHVKIKTDWYVELHRAKDSIDNPKSMIAAVLSETTDDLRQLFVDMPDVIDRITRYEEHVSHKFNHIIAMLDHCKEVINDLYGDGCARKDYAITAKEFWKNSSEFFGVQMNMLVRPEQSVEQAVKDVMLKNYKDYVLPSDLKLVNEE